jgi:serine/threonine-protein kinase
MAIEAGQQLLHYRVIEKIGEGGMGAVWRATDTSLNRDVAIKALPEQVAVDPERRARFEREARLLATLNHPNIATVYGFHQIDGTSFMAMELVVGEDLAQRIDRGPLPADQAVEIAHQIAEAFEVAHESGIIHRDLKPANVRITSDGKVKVLDFGLAKGLEVAAPDSDPQSSPTVTSLGTMAGAILGTAAYMSPEQARGQAADRRSDVWSFGALLYEMLSGNRPFDGSTASDTLAAVLRAEPDLASIPPATPVPIKTLVRRCLAKDPRRRLQSFAEARAWIEDARELPEDDAAPPAPAQAPAASRLPWLIALLALVAAIALAAAWWITAPEPPRPVHAAIVLDPLVSGGTNSVEILPDGHRILYVGARDGVRQVWLRDLSAIESRAIHGSAGDPILGDISPDGAWLTYSVEGKLRKSPIEGGASVSLAPVTPSPRGASWSSDGFIYYSPGTNHPIMRVSENGGDPEQVTSLPDATDEETLSQTNSHRWPTILPGNRGLIYLAGLAGNFAESRVELLELASGEVRVLQANAMYPRYLSTGHIAFIYEGTLTVMGFDAATLEVTSPPVAMVKGVRHMFGNGAASYSVADNGTLLYIPGEGSQVAIQLQRFMPDGEVRNLSEVAAILHPRISPDGRYVAYSKDLGSQGDIWVYDQERDVATRLTLEPNVGDYTPIWGPDGKWITYSSGSDGANLDIYRKRADGSGEAELVLGDEANLRAYSWSSDGSMLLFSKRTEDRGFDLHLQRFDPSGKPAGESVVLVASRDIDLHGAFSPDDRFVAYSSRESGVEHVYLSQVDGAGRWQVSDADGGQTPRWSGDGRRIYYHQGTGANSEVRFVEISIEQGSPRLGRPQVALSTPLASVQATSASFDVHPVDGSLAVTVALWELESSGHPVLVQGWGEELGRR